MHRRASTHTPHVHRKQLRAKQGRHSTRLTQPRTVPTTYTPHPSREKQIAYLFGKMHGNTETHEKSPNVSSAVHLPRLRTQMFSGNDGTLCPGAS